MAQIWKSFVKQTVTGTPGTGAFTLSAAVAGFQALAAGDDAGTGFFVAVEGTAWETFEGTYTHSGTSLARTVRDDSSTGSAISFTAAAVVYLDIVAMAAKAMMAAAQATPPGGRLTLTTGVPVTTADVTGATNVYYTPYLHNVITLWDGKVWLAIEFAQVTLALGTLSSGKPYDVFGFMNAGALNTELLAWTNGTTRATAVTLQDGRYCKSGDKTRLYLGTFYTTATTTTEDSGGGTTTQVGGKRFLWNMYNRVRRTATVIDTTDTWAYTTVTVRQANGASGNKVEFVLGMSEDVVTADVRGAAYLGNNVSADARSAPGLNSTTTFVGLWAPGYNTAGSFGYFPMGGRYSGLPAVGYNYISWNESGADNTCTFLGDNNGDSQTGLSAELFA